MADEEAEVVIAPGCLLGELAPSGVSEVVGLGERHLLLLLWW